MSLTSGLGARACDESIGTEGPYLRYTRGYVGSVGGSDRGQDRFEDTMGWLVKLGRKTGQPFARYFRLQEDRLSNHRNEHAPPTWTYSMLDSSVTLTARPNEISVRLASGRKFVLAAASRREFQRWSFALRRASVRGGIKLSKLYEIGDVIGDGVSGQVLSGIDRMTGETIAVKSLPLNNDDRIVTEEEICIAACLNHTHLVRTYDIFRDVDNATAHMVMEYAAGGELRARVDTPNGPLVTEKDGVGIARNLLGALKYLHERGIVHRDIKLENVLCVDANPNNPICVKLADFGSSAKLGSNRTTLNTQVGTSFYLAPEIIQKKPYGRPVDLWALGVLLYIALSGELPFPGTESEDYCHNAVSLPLEFPTELWSSFSSDACEFIEKLMDKNPDTRLTARDALQQAWITNPAIERIQISTDFDDRPDDSGETSSQSLRFDRNVSNNNIANHNDVDDNLPPLSLHGSLNRRNDRGPCNSLLFTRRWTAQEF